MHHIIHKQSAHDEVRSLALHENGLLTIYHRVTMLLHPVRDANMPSSGGVFGAIHAFEKWKNMAVRKRFLPPVGRADVKLFAFFHFSIEECMQGIAFQ